MVDTILESSAVFGLMSSMCGFLILFVNAKQDSEGWQLWGYIAVMVGFVFQLLPPTYALFA